jgi:glycolate oxidase
MRLIPRPQVRSLCLAVFPDAHAALKCSQQILLSGGTPSALEFLDSQTVGCTFSFWKEKDPEALTHLPDCLRKWTRRETPPAVLLIEVDGSAGEASQALELVVEVVRKRTGDWVTAIDSDTMELLWKVRRSCSQAMFELGPRKLNEDVVVPFEHQIDLLEFLEALHEETGLPTPTFGHAADGNFHAHIMYDDTDPKMRDLAESAVRRLMETVIDLQGAISGEHGIGLAKSPFFPLQHSAAEIAAMKAVKQALDPNNILNPGKFWTPCEPWTFKREDVRMPWDH